MATQLRTDQHNKCSLKAACLSLEVCVAILMSFRLPWFKYKNGQCFNESHCGCRFWSNNEGCLRSSWTYISFKKVGKKSVPLMVHQDIHDFWCVFGERGKRDISCDMIQTSQSFLNTPTTQRSTSRLSAHTQIVMRLNICSNC
jgi:hypothetical protein